MANPNPCPHCGCQCDVLGFDGECGLGREAPAADAPTALIDGQIATLDEAIERAAVILGQARYPLVYGLTALTCEAQRAAVALADKIGGCIDIAGDSPAALFPDLGNVTCTLGEIKSRADLIVFWCGRPDVTHARLVRELALDQTGRMLPEDWGTRSIISVGNRTAADSFAALWLLRALIQERSVGPSIGPVGGAPLADWQLIADRLRRCQYGVLILDPAECGPRAVEAGHGLATDLQSITRFSVLALRRPGNAVGAAQVLTWQTGYPSAVGLHAGYPQSFGGEYGADRVLARGETDAAVLVRIDSFENLSPAARSHLGRIPVVALSPRIASFSAPATVGITTTACANPGGGTIFRFDGLTMLLRSAISSSFPDDFQVLRRIEQALRRTAALH